MITATCDAILRACAQWRTGSLDTRTLLQHLVDLESSNELSSPVANELGNWRRHLQAALDWATTGDERGQGRAEGIVHALQAWAEELRLGANLDARADSQELER